MSDSRPSALGSPRALTALRDLRVQLEETRREARKIKRGPAPAITLVSAVPTGGRLNLTILGGNFQEGATVMLLEASGPRATWSDKVYQQVAHPLSDLGDAENPAFAGRGQISAAFDVPAGRPELAGGGTPLQALDRLLTAQREQEAAEKSLAATNEEIGGWQVRRQVLDAEIQDGQRRLTTLRSPKRVAEIQGEIDARLQQLAAVEADLQRLHAEQSRLLAKVDRLGEQTRQPSYWVVVTNPDRQSAHYLLVISLATGLV